MRSAAEESIVSTAPVRPQCRAANSQSRDIPYAVDMPLLVDVVNVLHVTGVLPPELAGPDEVVLAEMVARSRWAQVWVRLICDGGVPGERRPFPNLDIVLRWTGSRSADDVIVETAEQSSFARRITVVSNDRGLLARTKSLGCRALAGERFLERLAADALRAPRREGPAPRGREPRRRSEPRQPPGSSAPPLTGTPSARRDDRAGEPPLSPESVEAWMRTFGFGTSPPSSE